MPWTVVVCGIFLATGGAGALSVVCAIVFKKVTESSASSINAGIVKIRLIAGASVSCLVGRGDYMKAKGKGQKERAPLSFLSASLSLVTRHLSLAFSGCTLLPRRRPHASPFSF